MIKKKTGNARIHSSATCDHLTDEYFTESAVEHAGENRRYFIVSDIDEAREQWPSVVDCWM